MNMYELLKNKRDEIISIANKHGAYNIRVFGSVARNEATETSDIDFIIEVGENTSFFFPGGLIVDLENLLGKKVDIVTEKSLKPRIKDKVLREAKAI
jgi:predicted nucleotidyltransferase